MTLVGTWRNYLFFGEKKLKLVALSRCKDNWSILPLEHSLLSEEVVLSGAILASVDLLFPK